MRNDRLTDLENNDVLAGLAHVSALLVQVAELEAYQAGLEKGPCVEALRTRRAVGVALGEESAAQWPEFMARLTSAGYQRAYGCRCVGRVRGWVRSTCSGSPRAPDLADSRQTTLGDTAAAVVGSARK